MGAYVEYNINYEIRKFVCKKVSFNTKTIILIFIKFYN